ncbi:Uncharacterized protein Rs2_21880 [Raphanus sativus]|nr:Uncharacterized protein Rs2_21880 [Raphanus sativus]
MKSTVKSQVPSDHKATGKTPASSAATRKPIMKNAFLRDCDQLNLKARPPSGLLPVGLHRLTSRSNHMLLLLRTGQEAITPERNRHRENHHLLLTSTLNNRDKPIMIYIFGIGCCSTVLKQSHQKLRNGRGRAPPEVNRTPSIPTLSSDA